LSPGESLTRYEAIVDRAAIAPRVEALLPIGVRPRQLAVRTLLIGMLLAQADDRPGHLVRVRAALLALPAPEQRRLGVVVDRHGRPHRLTYRQTEYTFSLITHALAKPEPDGTPSEALRELLDVLIEASIPTAHAQASTALALDWSDVETFSCPPSKGSTDCADPEAHWGHRSGGGPGQKDDMFFGYYLSAATMIREDGGAPVPELASAITLTSCAHDPPQAAVAMLQRRHQRTAPLGDIVCDSGYAHRTPGHLMAPLRALGARLVMDLHPSDRGPRGTHQGAILANGNLFCPCTTRALLDVGPLARGASPEEVEAHNIQTAEVARYKLGRITADDPDGYHRVECPAVAGKLRCPLRPESMALDHDRPEVLTPPEHPPTCCTQATISVPASVNAKTAQKHDYPGPAWRRSYGRRTAVERTFSTVKDPATNNIGRGWCRVMGLSAISLFVVAVFVVRNCRVVDAFEARTADDARRAGLGLGPKTRKRRRKTLGDLAANAPP
jgi:hypothetical protein